MDKPNTPLLELEELPPGSGCFPLKELLPGQSCSVKISFRALQLGEQTIRTAEFTCDRGEIEPLSVEAVADSTIKLELKMGVAVFAYTLTRLSLNLTA
jgi:hypothetical protein